MSVYIEIRFTDADIEQWAHDAEIPLEEARKRAAEWGKYIEQTATELCSDYILSYYIRQTLRRRR